MTYSEHIDQKVYGWVCNEKINSWIGSITKISQEERAKNTNMHKLSQIGCVGLVQKLEKELSRDLIDLKRTELWTRARLDDGGQYMNEEVKEISDKIVS